MYTVLSNECIKVISMTMFNLFMVLQGETLTMVLITMNFVVWHLTSVKSLSLILISQFVSLIMLHFAL